MKFGTWQQRAGLALLTILLGGSPALAADAPLASLEKPVVVRTATSATDIPVRTAAADGRFTTMAVTVPAGAVAVDSAIALSPGRSEADPVGYPSLRLAVTDAANATLASFAKPIAITLPVGASASIPAWTEDGATWTSLLRLADATLSDDARDGYYLAADGSIVVLTLHPGTFALQAAQPVFKLAVAVPGKSWAVGSRIQVAVLGGIGEGAVDFEVLTPDTCTITSQWLVTGFGIGECLIIARKAGDMQYLDTESDPLVVPFVRASAAKPTITVRPTTNVPTTPTNVKPTVSKPASGWKTAVGLSSLQTAAAGIAAVVKAGSGMTGSITVSANKAFSVQLTGLGASTVVTPMVIAPTGVSVFVSTAASNSQGTVVLPAMKISAKGEYRILARLGTTSTARLITVKVV